MKTLSKDGPLVVSDTYGSGPALMLLMPVWKTMKALAPTYIW